MKRLISFVIAPLIVLMFIWIIVGYSKFGDDIVNKHLDLLSTFDRLTNYDYDFQLITIWNNLVERLSDINSSSAIGSFVDKLHISEKGTEIVSDILSGLRSIVSPIALFGNLAAVFGSILDVFIEFFHFVGGYILSIFNFIFNPVFV